MKMRIASSTWLSLVNALSARRDVESAGLLFVETVRSPHGDILLVREAFAVPESAYVIRRRDQLRLDPVALNRLIRPARDRGLGVFTIHTHPGATTAEFSPADDSGDARLLPSFSVQNPEAVHGSIVITDGGGDRSARYLGATGLAPIALDIIGTRVVSSARQRVERDGAFVRQELALGEAGHVALRSAVIGVVGAGGTGSVVAAQLAHVGVGTIVVMDGDNLERSNVSRVLGATVNDVGMPKVDIVCRYLRSLGLGTIVRSDAEKLGPSNAGQLRSCDVIISCVDRHVPRAILNRLAYDALVPIIDIGTAFRVADDGRLLGDAGRLIVIGPERPCLACWGAIDPARLRIESLSGDEREAQAAAGYIDGQDVAAPSVMPFNVMVAGAACIEVLRLLAGFDANRSCPDRLSFSFSDGIVKRNSLRGASACTVCGRSRRAFDSAAE